MRDLTRDDFFDADGDDDDGEEEEPVPESAAPEEGAEDVGDLFGYLDSTKKLTKHPWMLTRSFVLVTPENITQCIDACIGGVKGRCAIDLETTGLDNRVDSTTGATKDQIVGVCLSGDGQTGWYIPLRHQKGAEHNVPFQVFDPEFRRLMAAIDEGKVVAVFHNALFDHEFLEFNGREAYGDWDTPRHWEDTLILAYLRHSRARRKSLKQLAGAPTDDPSPEQISRTGGRGLGMRMFELEDLFPKPEKGQPPPKLDFSLVNPADEKPLIYGCSDAICTWLLADLLLEDVLKPTKHTYTQRSIYIIEKLCVTATRWMQRNRMLTDPVKIMDLIKLGQQEWFDAVMTVYTAASEILGRDVMPGYYKVLLHGSPEDGSGRFVADNSHNLLPQQVQFAKSRELRWYPNPMGMTESQGKKWPYIYDVNAPQQLGRLFEEMKVPGLKFTEKSKQVMTSKAELARVIAEAEDRFPFMGKIRRFRETNKALTNYLYPMLESADPVDHTMRINFNPHKTDTGRFSTPAKERELDVKSTKRMPGWPEINLHSTPAGYDPKRPECMTRIRECIVARPGYFIVAIDFSGEELRLVTNLAQERKWLAEFFHCSGCNRRFDTGDGSGTPIAPPARCPNCGSDKIGDLHTLTALSIYGEDAPKRENWKSLRGKAKSVNFALCYGGGGNAVVRSTGCDKNEGWRIKAQFDQAYTGLRNWWTGQHKFAKQYGFVLTAFGRVYPVPDIWSSDGGFRSKAERNSVNGPIQGCQIYEARVWTNKGAIQIGDLWSRYGSARDQFEVWTGVKWSPARALSSGMKQKAITTFASGNQTRTSPDHRFLVYKDGPVWVRQEQLAPGDWVLQNAAPLIVSEPRYQFSISPGTYSNNAKGYAIQGNSAVLWEFLGMVYGDGSIRPNHLMVHVGGNRDFPEFDPKSHATEWVKQLNSALDVGAIVHCQRRAEGERRLPTWQICVHNRAFRTFCRDILGVQDQNTWTKRFPVQVWEESQENRAAFLRGLFSTDGTAGPRSLGKDGGGFSMRSTNEGLLRDTLALLASLGIRASCRVSSKRVTILDRLRFRDLVGFNVGYKAKRASELQIGAYFYQRHALPPSLVAHIGEAVYSSSIYAGLPRAKKSAVLRLKAGSGSKTQCQDYLAKLSRDEVPAWIVPLLQYDYEQVATVEATEEQVEMYDIEVFDDVHAFVCDGVIVHNSGADIIKIGMGLVYKEIKKRGWFDKVRLIATMHDELDFEVHGSVLEESIAVLIEILTRNTLILSQKWPVPLTTDCEIGLDWAVNWAVNEMTAREVRFEGNKKIKEPKKPQKEDFEGRPADFQRALAEYPEKATTWKAMPHSWPEALRLHFNAAQGLAAREAAPATPEATPAEVSDVSVGAPVTEVSVPRDEPLVPVGAVSSDNCNVTILSPLTPGVCSRLANLINDPQVRGTKKLRLLVPDGTMLPTWSETDHYVNPNTLYILARDRGLQIG